MTEAGETADSWWETRYRQQHTPWDRQGPSPALTHWLARGRLRPGRILVPGCGRGHEVIELARAGFAVTALDFAPSAVTLLRQRLREQQLQAQILDADMLGWQAQAPFDAVYEQTSLCALPPSQWHAYARQLHDWLRPGGELYALFMQTDRAGGPPYHCELAQMRQLFPQDLWRWPTAAELELSHPAGFVEHAYVLVRVGVD